MTRITITRSAVQEPPYHFDLACIPIEAVPFTLGALVLRSQKYWYASDEDWQRGRRLLALLGKGILMPCGRDIVNSIDRLYTLTAAGLSGTAYSVSGSGTDADPFVYSPPLPQVVDPEDYQSPSLRRDTAASRRLMENLVLGTTSADAPTEAVTNAKLEAIRLLLEAMGTSDGPTFAQMAQVIAILGA
jgi:hypothetical protein